MEPECVVGPRASERQRRTAFLEATARRWTLRQACGAAGITRRRALEWLSDPAFLEEYGLAQGQFLDAIEETLLAMATGRGGKTMRSSVQALQQFLSSNHEVYFRSRVDSLLRQSALLTDSMLAVLRRHVDEATVEAVRKELETVRTSTEATGGTHLRAV